MYCFSALGRAVLSACYDPSAHPQAPLPAKSDPPKMPSAEASPPPPAYPDRPEKSEKPTDAPRPSARARQQQVEDEILKELEPTYVAPKRVGVVVSSREVKDPPTKSGRFDLDEHTEDAWEVDL